MGNAEMTSRLRTDICQVVEGQRVTQIEKRPLSDFAVSLRLVAEEFAPGSSVPVPRERLLELLSLLLDGHEVINRDQLGQDLRVNDVANRIRRKTSTVRQMCAAGEFDMPTPGEGAYKHRGKEWLIPEVAVLAYEQRERLGGRVPRDSISDWKRVRRKRTHTTRRNDAA